MPRHTRSAKAISQKAGADWPFVVYAWIAGLGFASYIVARIVLDSQPHPVHWASGLAGAIAGYFIGWLWYHWRGDLI